jgi:hypothetical protein
MRGPMHHGPINIDTRNPLKPQTASGTLESPSGPTVEPLGLYFTDLPQLAGDSKMYDLLVQIKDRHSITVPPHATSI